MVSFERSSTEHAHRVRVTEQAARAAYDNAPPELREGNYSTATGFTIYRYVRPGVRAPAVSYRPIQPPAGED